MAEQETRPKKKNRRQRYFDYSLLAVIVFLCCFGLIMVYSSSSYAAQVKTGDSLFYLKKQGVALILGFVCMFLVSRIDYHKYAKVAVLGYLLAFVLMILVNFTPLGIEYNGKKRWFGFGSTSLFQAAEAVKVAVILSMASLVNKFSRKIDTWKAQLLILILQAPLILLVADNNLSSGIILLGIVFVVLFVASRKKLRFFMAVAIVAALAVFVTVFSDKILELHILKEYQLERILLWKDPTSYALEGGHQVLQGLYAIGSGGLFGKGLGESMQKLGFVPEAQNDMVFSIICEELGLFGAICVILLFLFMIWRFVVIANNAPDLFGAMLVVGIMSHIALQVILNVAVVTNTIPNTGITLPFISYGGTSVVFLMVEMGAALSVSSSIRFER
ncbi:FtsW/RodA/SpoVE family cell cycle protein [Fusibacillus kribbianus]|uniref:Probable peptidoglycan glycosyltransferase FtsW n=1 Tax=Fusibacillus kribbianus TaxID=3044208 RepID=A0AAP4B9U5_9FIRM|nr:putative peptidoglycan glycosyltransferase FtsW [Ruminococcus sp. YH-rum2234]MDI9241328.1 putative peptidoglycan glycosyltransferase FtsW [Ruminococcus sp. YH-rum2234]